MTIDEIPEPNLSQEEIERVEREGKMFVYLPFEFCQTIDIAELGEIFPELHDQLIDLNTKLVNTHTPDHPHMGWIELDAARKSPNLGSTADKLKSKFAAEGREGATYNTLLIASISMPLSSRIASPSGDGENIFAVSFDFGTMTFYNVGEKPIDYIGARSVRVIPQQEKI